MALELDGTLIRGRPIGVQLAHRSFAEARVYYMSASRFSSTSETPPLADQASGPSSETKEAWEHLTPWHDFPSTCSLAERTRLCHLQQSRIARFLLSHTAQIDRYWEQQRCLSLTP